MRSGTSFFNSTLYHKTMRRFWPLWALYGLIWLFALPLSLLNQYLDYTGRYSASDVSARLLDTAINLPQLLSFGVVLAAVISVLCAMAVFGYLYQSRSAAMMHALPLRRETLFVTQYLAGLSFLLLPNLVVAALTAAVEIALLPSSAWAVALKPLLIWLLAQSGVCLFFFSFAAFCAMFTGHLLALPAFYGILNFLVLCLYELITSLVTQLYYGVCSTPSSLVRYCTPMLMLMDACDWDSQIVDGVSTGTRQLSSPGAVAAYAAVGLVFAALALMIYQRRHIETAGDVVSVPLVRPIFKYGVAVCSGLALGIFTSAFFSWQENGLLLSLSLLLWAAAGYFAAEMLLKKSFRVFRAWKGCAVMTALLALLCVVAVQDVFGLVTKVPAPEQIKSIRVDAPLGYPYDSGRYLSEEITNPEQIEKFVALHRAIVANPKQSDSGDDYTYLNINYRLTSGATLSRQYYDIPLSQDELEQEGSVTWCAQQLLQDRGLLERRYHFQTYEQGQLVAAELQYIYDSASGQTENRRVLDMASPAQLMELWQAVRQDFDEGTIGVRYLFEDETRLNNTYRTDLNFTWLIDSAVDGRYSREDGTYSMDLTITLTPNASHTLELLEQMGALDERHALLSHTGDPVETAAASELP